MASAASDPQEIATSVRPGNIDALTGLRFIAALTIALGHYYPPWGTVTLVGMPLFFTLSGFIIHYIYSRTFESGWSAAASAFAAARVSRIYPLYLALFIFAFVSTPMGKILWQGGSIWTILSYIFPCFTWFPLAIESKLPIQWYYGISWSVSTEIFFYIAYALIFFRLHNIRNSMLCLIILIAFCASTYLVFYTAFLTRDFWEPLALQYVSGLAHRDADFANSFYRWLLYTSPYARVFEFVGGCLTCQLYLLVRESAKPSSRFIGELLAWAPCLMIVGTLMIYWPIAQRQPWLAIGDHSFASFFINLHMNFLLAPFCYLLIFALAWSRSTVSWILSWSGLVLLGEISYSTYLGHPLARGFANGLWLPQSTPAALVCQFVIIYLLSWILYSAIEVPAKAGLRRLFAKQPIGFVASSVGRLAPSSTAVEGSVGRRQLIASRADKPS